MYIEKLFLSKFRNYLYEDIDFIDGINIFFGNNAQGKTNLLEAIYVCANAKSFKTKNDLDFIMFNENNSTLKAKIRDMDFFRNVVINISKKDKEIIVNDIKYDKNKQLRSLFKIILFTPDDIKIIKQSPKFRRDMIDDMLFDITNNFRNLSKTYNTLLYKRNALIKNKTSYFSKQLDIYDIELSKYGYQILKIRENFIKKFEKHVSDNCSILSEKKENLTFRYEKSIDAKSEKEYRDILFSHRDRDVRTYTTNFGVHRDDLEIMINGKNIKNFGSQGQIRSSILSIKISFIELLDKIFNKKSIVLLDDVFSELDKKRSIILLDKLKNYQTIITTTDFTNISHLSSCYSRHIVEGKIR